MPTSSNSECSSSAVWRCAPEFFQGPQVQSPFSVGMELPNIYAMLTGPQFRPPVHLKIEGRNLANSIKLKAALAMVRALEQSGQLRPGGKLIESSSGNLGVALAIISMMLGYEFICVTDPVCSRTAKKQMLEHGAKVVTVTERDAAGGFLGTRIRYIKQRVAGEPGLIWVNQYANENNWRSHYLLTAPEIHRAFAKVDYLFVGAGTCGTLMGCIRYFAEHSPATRIIAVDAVGSTTFGGPAKPRKIPGIGTSETPPILNRTEVPTVEYASEEDAVRVCHSLARGGLSVGGSTGSVLSVVERWAPLFSADHTVVAISPDLGTKYNDTIYNTDWCRENFPGLTAMDLAA